VNANSGPGRPLHYAVGGYGYPEVVQLLLAKGADVDAVGPDGTALSLAAARESIELVELLLKHKANPNLEDFRGKRPLHNAARRGNERIAELLLDHGADMNARMIGDETALHEAMKYRHLSLMQLLLERGADVNLETAHGTILHQAEQQQREDAVKLLLKYGAKRSAMPRR
jgi:ankyrin repeat protein